MKENKNGKPLRKTRIHTVSSSFMKCPARATTSFSTALGSAASLNEFVVNVTCQFDHSIACVSVPVCLFLCSCYFGMGGVKHASSKTHTHPRRTYLRTWVRASSSALCARSSDSSSSSPSPPPPPPPPAPPPSAPPSAPPPPSPTSEPESDAWSKPAATPPPEENVRPCDPQ